MTDPNPNPLFDDEIIKSIDEFLPFRNEAIQLFITIAQYAPEEQFIHRFHRFFERLILYMKKPSNICQYSEWDFDNYKFIVHELFLYALAILLKYERMEQANYLLQQQYYLPGNLHSHSSAINSFTVFWEPLYSFEHRKHRLQLNLISIRAGLLKDRCTGTGIDFHYLLQADFVAYVRAELQNNSDSNNINWWPETLVYLGDFHKQFEIFARSVSKTYFNKSKVLLGINDPKDLDPLLKSYENGSRHQPSFGLRRFSVASLLGYENLATLP